jgi:hypothetical protein
VGEPLPSFGARQAYDVRRQDMLGNARVGAILVATDIERAKKFYVEKLGLRVVETSAPNGDFAMFEAGDGTMLYL